MLSDRQKNSRTYTYVLTPFFRLRSFSEEKVENGIFELPKGAEVSKSPFGSMFASNEKHGGGAKSGGLADACYEQVCCGQVQGDAKMLSGMVAKKTMGYRLEATAMCDFLGLGALLGVNTVEGAMYKQGKKAVTVTLDTDAKDKGIVLKTKEGEAHGGPAKVTSYKTGFIGEYVYYYAVLTPMNVQQLDIIIDGQTLISLSHPVAQGKVPLVKFAKESIDFEAYSSAASKQKAHKQPKEKAAPSASEDEADDTKEEINKGVDEAVDMLKSLF